MADRNAFAAERASAHLVMTSGRISALPDQSLLAPIINTVATASFPFVSLRIAASDRRSATELFVSRPGDEAGEGCANIIKHIMAAGCNSHPIDKVGPRGRLTIEAPIGVAQFIELIAIAGQALDRDPAVPVG